MSISIDPHSISVMGHHDRTLADRVRNILLLCWWPLFSRSHPKPWDNNVSPPPPKYYILYRLTILPSILDSCIHDNYHEALIHQMGLLDLSNQKVWDKLEYNNAVEESSLVCIDSTWAGIRIIGCGFLETEDFSYTWYPQGTWTCPSVFFCVPQVLASIDAYTAVQVENDRFVTLRFTCVILSLAYSSKLYAIVNVCPSLWQRVFVILSYILIEFVFIMVVYLTYI